MTEKNIIKPSLFMAILPIILTLTILGIQLFYYGDFTPHIPLAIGIAITATMGWFRGYRWDDMEKGVMHVIRVGLPSIAILNDRWDDCRRLDCLRYCTSANILRIKSIESRNIFSCSHGVMCRSLCISRNILGHNRYRRPCPDGYWFWF